MGLFSKSNPAEDKLKELTGGFILSNQFMDRLKREGLEISDGTQIREQIKKEIKNGTVTEINVESRLNQLINERKNPNANSSPAQLKTNSTLKKKCPKCSKNQDSSNEFCIYCGYKFYTESSNKPQKKCPVCRKMQDSDNTFCISCGHNFNLDKVKPSNVSKEVLEVTCPYCDLTQPKSNSFCENCGYDFEKQRLPSDYTNCPNCDAEVKKTDKICSNCGYDFKPENDPENEIHINKVKFLANYNFNLKNCPKCNTQMLKIDPFCFNCGESVVTAGTVKNDNLEVKDGKLVAKTQDTHNDELSELEALYSRTVKSKYSPSFRIAYVLFLNEFEKNPTKKFSDKLARHYETTPNKLKKQALEDEFIEIAPAISEAKKSKVTDLKEILKEHGLKVSGKKDELIERLQENLTEEELKKYFKSKNHQISDKGREFLEKNNYILYIEENKDIASVFYPSEIIKIFGDEKYSLDEIYDMLLEYLTKVFDEILSQERWVDFKTYSNAIAEILEDKGDLKKALSVRFKVFLFDVNNFSIVTGMPNAKSTKLKQKDLTKLTQLMHNLSLSIDEVKELFYTSYDEILFKTEITKEDSLIYLLKAFGGEDLEKISIEINEKYSNPH